jgi:adenine-specific DNA-methyltransferase
VTAPASPPSFGRLTLSWVGKDQALLGTPVGGYRWVPRDDPRVTEVRLLHETDTVGEVRGATSTASGNLLIVGDSYDALHSLNRIPEYAGEYRGRVKLVYIDPPFNTGQAFEHYDDALEHSVWLTMMRDRLLLIRDLLAPNGSVWVHLDDAEMTYCRVLMDEIFGRDNFVSCVIWQKIHARNNSAQHFSTVHDYIIVFAKDRSQLTLGRVPRTELSDADFWNPDDDPRGDWRRSDLTASHQYSEGKYEVTGPHGDVFKPRDNRWWSLSQASFEALRADDRLWWGKTGRTFPFRKRFASELGSLIPNTFWTHDEVGDNREAKAESTRLFGRTSIFTTPKPERLLKRVIEIGSSPGDIVLDCFAGSGTTAAVAQKMERHWVTVELSPQTVETFTRPRLEMVVNGDPGGITDTVGWKKGGGFRVLEVGQSMYDLVDGRAFLAEWVTNGGFAKAVAAQLGFTVQDEPPFCGVKGRSRLAVIDGVLDEQVIRAIAARLGNGERAVVVGKGATADAGPLLKELSPGSRMRKAPRDLLKRGVVR